MSTSVIALALFSCLAQAADAQSLLGKNLLVNGDAEADPGVTSARDAKMQPPTGWKVTGNLTVAQYDGHDLFNTGYAPPKPGKTYFSGGAIGKSSMSQSIDVAAESAAIDGNSALFTLQGYLGGSLEAFAELTATFKKADGTVLLTTNTVSVHLEDRIDQLPGILLRIVNGTVPAGTRTIDVQVGFPENATEWNEGAADNLSLVLARGAMFGANLIQNGDAESIDGAVGKAVEGGDTISPLPGWNVRGGMTVARYGDPDGFPTASDPGPVDRAKQLFAGGQWAEYFDGKATGWQTFELAGIGSTIDAAAVTWNARVWLGGYEAQADNAALFVRHYDAANKLISETVLGPITPDQRSGLTGLVQYDGTGAVPVGTRRIEVGLVMTCVDGGYNDGYADNVSFVLTSSISNVTIKTGGVVNAASGLTGPLAPGEVISIFGSSLGPSTAIGMETDGNAKVLATRGGVTIAVSGVPAPLLMVQSGQINAIVPYEVAGKSNVQLVVDNNGSKSAAVDLGVAATSPGVFTVDGSGKGQGVILNSDFTLNSAANPAAKGGTITILCTGLGQTAPGVGTGQFTTAGSVPKAAVTPTLQIGGQAATVQFAGLMEYGWPGVYQIVATVPSGAAAGNNISLSIGGSGQTGVTIAVK